MLVGRHVLRHGLRQTGPNAECGLPPVMVVCPIPNNHLQMALVQWNQEVKTLATKAPPSGSHTEFAFGARTGVRKTRTQIRQTFVDSSKMRSRSWMRNRELGMIVRQRFRNCCSVHSARGMGSDVFVENLAGSDLYDDEDV